MNKQWGLRRYAMILACISGGLVWIGCEKTPSLSPHVETKEPTVTPALPKRDVNAVEAITFADIDLPLDAADDYQAWMLTQRVHDLTGKRVRIAGFMSSGLFQLKNIREFVLMRDLDCCFFGPGGTADHLIQVKLTPGADSVTFTTAEMVVEGKLSISPYLGSDGKTWSVYLIEATQVMLKE